MFQIQKNYFSRKNVYNSVNKAIQIVREDLSILRIHSLNRSIFLQNPNLDKFLYKEHLFSLDCNRKSLLKLLNKNYRIKNFLDLNFFAVHQSMFLQGTKNLLHIIFSKLKESEIHQKKLMISFLESEKQFSQKTCNLISDNHLTVIRINKLKPIVEQERKDNELIFWGNHDTFRFKNKVAHIVIASSEFHYLSSFKKENLLFTMKNSLKDDGLCIIQIFEKKGLTSKWYKNIVNNYGTTEDQFSFISREQINEYLRPYFKNITAEYFYDPFYLEGEKGQSSQSLKREFYCYLIRFFNLQKLLPQKICIENLKYYKDRKYWDRINRLFLPYFKLDKEEKKHIDNHLIKNSVVDSIDKMNVPFVEELTFKNLDCKRLCLIAPRISLINIGRCSSVYE